LEYKRRIFGYECDIYGHLNNANYLHLYEEARSEALIEMGIPVKEFHRQGINIYIININVDFKKGIPLEEEVTIFSEIIECNRLWGLWKQKIFDKKGDLCSQALVKGVFVKNGAPRRLSPELFARFEKYLPEK